MLTYQSSVATRFYEVPSDLCKLILNYPMPATNNFFSTSPCGVGEISSTNSQQPLATVATARTDPS